MPFAMRSKSHGAIRWMNSASSVLHLRVFVGFLFPGLKRFSGHAGGPLDVSLLEVHVCPDIHSFRGRGATHSSHPLPQKWPGVRCPLIWLLFGVILTIISAFGKWAASSTCYPEQSVFFWSKSGESESQGPRADGNPSKGTDALLGFRVLAPDSFGQVGFPSEDAALLHELPLVGPELGPSNPSDSNSSQSRWGLARDANARLALGLSKGEWAVCLWRVPLNAVPRCVPFGWLAHLVSPFKVRFL